MTQIKICGLTNLDDALHAAGMGADMLGFIFAPVSKRYIAPEDAAPIITQVRQRYPDRTPLCVGVFVADETITPEIMLDQCRTSGVDAAQVVGMSDPAYLTALRFPSYACIRPETSAQAIREAERFARIDDILPLPTLQLDAFHPNLYGGTGETAPKAVARILSKQTPCLMLSGGLNPENVAEYVRDVRPWAVDVASGTEASPGKKDPTRVRDFIQAARSIGDMT